MSVKSRDQQAKETEQEILDYLREQPEAVSFYKLYTDLSYTSGKAQSALKRLRQTEEVFIHKKIDKFKTFVYHEDFDVDPDVLELEDEDTLIFPVRMSRMVGTVLEEVPELSDDYSNFMDLVKKALIMYFQTLEPDLKRKVIESAIKKGKITEELGKRILGE